MSPDQDLPPLDVPSEPAAFDRSPPYSAEAEVAVLGGMLIDATAVERAAGVVDEGMFYPEKHRRLFRAMLRLHERGDAIDVVTLAEDLRSAGEFKGAGGMEYLAALLDAVPTAANIEYHARIVREKAALRRLIEAGQSITAAAYANAEPAEMLQAEAERLVAAAVTTTDAPLTRVKDLLWDVLAAAEKYGTDATPPGIEWGLTACDDLVPGGFQPGELVVIAGRPSMGKTAAANGIAANASIKQRRLVAFFSLETKRHALTRRFLASEARVNMQAARRRGVQDHEYPRLGTAAGLLNAAPLYLDDTPSLTINALRAKLRALLRSLPKRERDEGLGLVAVDYLQLMSDPAAKSDYQEVSRISKGLKAVAMEFDCVVAALSQLSRRVEERPEKKPMISDLKESGQIEQDADAIALLYRPEYYFGSTVRSGRGSEQREYNVEGMAEIIFAKVRDGKTGTARVRYSGEYTLFEDWHRAS
jgi:replicative DNA helicase